MPIFTRESIISKDFDIRSLLNQMRIIMFKKMLAAVAIVATITTAHAEDRISLGYRVDSFGAPKVACAATARCRENNQTNYIINYDSRVNDKLQVGLGLQLSELNTYVASTNNRLTNRYMLRFGYDFNKYVYLNGVIGSKKTSSQPSTEFWNAEAGVKYRINDKWQVRAGYWYREGFKGPATDYEIGPTFRVQYTINPRYNVALTYDDFKFTNENRQRIGIQLQKRFP